MDDFLYFDYNQKSSVLLFFFVNAIIFSSLLFRNGYVNTIQNSKWLGFFILLCGLYISPFMCGYGNWYSKKPYREFLFFMPLQQLFLIGPVLYFYTQSLLSKPFKFSKKDFIHFVPAILYLIYALIIIIVDKIVLEEFYFYADGRDKDLDFWYQMCGLISMLFYLYLSLKKYTFYRKQIVDEVSYADEISFKWIRVFLIAFALILLLRVLFFILNPEWGQFGSKYWYYLCFSILFYFIAFAGYSHAIKANSRNLIFQSEKKTARNHEYDIQKDDITSENLKYWKTEILKLMTVEKLYTNPNLTLTDIADRLETNRNIISKTINQEFEMNFNDFINQKRTEAIIEKLKEGKHNDITLLGLALECGFNSKTTFNRAFKKYTSFTPKQFIEKNQL